MNVERKLAAILCADVHGYSRLMGQDEEATLRTLSDYRKIIDGLIASHRGRFVNSAGDSILAEFTSVVEAVTCAVEIQTALKAENQDLPLARQMEFRIGVNSGDVIVEGDQIYGDGVNVAARLESLADPGGICISGTVYEQVRDRLALRYEDRGEQSVKNIARPVHVWRVVPDGTPTSARLAGKYWRRGVLSLTGLAIAVGTFVLVQHLSLKPPHTSGSVPPTEKPALSLPSIPSIAVLPFTNLSGDPSQEYFSDGLSDYLITELSRLPAVFVIARNSTFFYKGKTVTVQQVGRELGVRTVLQGSVLRARGRVRINVQLADAENGANIWAQSFDEPVTDVFAVQDEVTRQLVTTLSEFFKIVNLNVPLASRLSPTDNLEAFDYLLRGEAYYWRLTEDGNAKARPFFEKAIALDPKFADAYANLGWTYAWAARNQWSRHPERDLKQADELARKALALDDSNPLGWWLLSRDDWYQFRYDEAVTDAKRAVALNPNFASSYLALGEALLADGKPGEAIPNIQRAQRLDPKSRDLYASDLGAAELFVGKYREAVQQFESFNALHPENLLTHMGLAIAYTELGKAGDARAEAAEVMRLNPQFKVPPPDKFPNKDIASDKRFCTDLRKAGLN
jgi:adenylate cyclase